MTAIEFHHTAAENPTVPVLAGLWQAIMDKFGSAKTDTGAQETAPGCLRRHHDKNIATIARIDPASLAALM